MKKRMVSLLLTFAMLLSMVIIPASAEGESAPLTFSTVSFTEATTTFGTEIASAATNEVFAVKIKISNPNDTDFYAKALDLWMQYDESTLEPYSYKSGRTTVGPVVQVQDDFFSVEATVQNGLAKLSGASSSGTWLEAKGGTYDSTVIAYILFKVKADAERCNLAFSVTGDNNKILGTATEAGTDQLPMPGVSFEGITTSVTIAGATPTLQTVTLDGIAEKEVRVNGTDEVTPIKLKAASLKGTDLTASVEWSVSPADGGVSIDATGVITVANNAKAGEYTITAAPKDDKVQGGAQSATLTVVRETAVATTISLSPESASVTIPGTGEAAATVDFTATVKDQYGDTMPNETLQIVCENLVTGIKTGVGGNFLTVSVSSDAAQNITGNSQTFTVTATCGTLSATASLTVSKAAPVVKSIVIGGAATIAVPTKAEAQKEIPYTATVQDQYCTVLTGKTVTWSIEETALNGVTIDKNSGTVTIRPAAAKNTFDENNQPTFTVKAICEGKSAAKVVTLKREPSTVDGLTVSGGQDNIEIPADNSTNSSAAFTVAVTDQYGQPMDTPENVTWTIKDSTGNYVNGVTIDNGVVKVTSAAAGSIKNTTGKELTVTAATSGDKFGTATITVKRAASKVSQLMFRDELTKDDTNYTVPTSGTNGKEFWAIIFKDQYGSEMNVPAEDVTWTFPTLEGVTFKGYTSGSYHRLSIMVQRAAAKNAFTNNALEFTVTATYKNTQISASMKCTLTRNAAVASSMVLDGDNSDTIVIPSTKKYTATVKDQYDLVMPGAQVTYSIEPVDNYVSIGSDGTVTVLAGATKDREYTITATYSQNVTATRKFKAVDKVSDTTTLKVEQADITFGESVNHKVTGKPAAATAVTFTYEALEGSALTDGQPVNKGQYKVIARCESDTTIYTAEDTFEIKAKAITADMFTVTEKTYTYNGIGYDFEYQTTLVKNTDYTVTGTSYKDAGTYTVAFAGQGNYTGEVKVAWTITPAVLKVKSVQLTSRAYDPSSSTVSVAAVEFEGLVAGETLSAANNYIAQATLANNNAGTRTAQVTVTLRTGTTEKAKNYTFENGVVTATVSADVQISKIAYEGTTTASTSAKYGNTATLDLSALGLPEGYDFAQGRVQDENGILAGAEAAGYYVISGNTLRVPLVNNAAKVGKTATITLPVSSTNYASFDLVITVTVNDKLENSLAANDIYLTYGDTGYVTVTSIIGSLRTEIVDGEDVISLDNGTIKTLKAGTATLKLTASGDKNYAEKSIQVKVTVSPKPITLTIDSKSAYVNDAQPALTYKVNGLVGADTLTTVPALFVDVAEGVDPMKQVGTYAIKTSVRPSAGVNYSLTVAEGTLSVTNRPSAITPVGPSAGTVRVDETEGGTVRVTPANAAEGSTVTIVVTPDQGQELRSLEVLDKDGDSLELTDLGGGRFSFEMPRGKVTVKAEFGKAGLPYHDVKEGDWFYSAVEYVTEAGLMGDTGHGSFEPNTNTTRAMIWAILARLSGVDTTPVSGPWYSVAQEWAMNSGVSDGTNPNGAITREQLVTMLYRYAETHGIDVTEGGMAIREFADVESVSSFAGPAMTWAVNTGLISGIDGKLVPQGLATRSQVATVLMRFAQLAK